MLSKLGKDLPGAIEIYPVGDSIYKATNSSTNTEPNQSQYLKFSLAGIQLKFSAFEKDGALTIPTEGVGGSDCKVSLLLLSRLSRK